MKKLLGVACLVFVLVFSTLSSVKAEAKWFKSTDGMLEISLINITSKSYPVFDLEYQLRLDGQTMSEVLVKNIDLSDEISDLITQNPTLKNRKIKADASIVDGSLKSIGEIEYGYSISIILQNTKTLNFSLTTNLSEAFPNDFVDYDVVYAVNCMKLVKSKLLNPDSLEISEAVILDTIKNKGRIKVLIFTISAQNKMGGKTANHVYALYEVNTGVMDIVKPNKLSVMFGSIYIDKVDTWYTQKYGSLYSPILDSTSDIDTGTMKVLSPELILNSL